MLSSSKGKPDDKLLRHALNRWAFNKARRASPECPRRVKEALRWLECDYAQGYLIGKPQTLDELIGRA